MEKSVPIRSILQGEGEGRKVLVRGWLQNKRSSGGIIFALLRDGTGVIQCTLRKENVPTELFGRSPSADSNVSGSRGRCDPVRSQVLRRKGLPNTELATLRRSTHL